MLDNNITESSWASPCLLVKKPDETHRPCTELRKANNVPNNVTDAFPLCCMVDTGRVSLTS